MQIADFDGDMRKHVIGDGLYEPTSIAVYPSEGWLFWTDSGQDAKIERGGMDGKFREVSGFLYYNSYLTAFMWEFVGFIL